MEHIRPLFPAVYDADVDISLEGEAGEHELLGVLKQAAFQLSSTDAADKALATALATLVIAEDPSSVVVDASGISEALEEPFNVSPPCSRSLCTCLCWCERANQLVSSACLPGIMQQAERWLR